MRDQGGCADVGVAFFFLLVLGGVVAAIVFAVGTGGVAVVKGAEARAAEARAEAVRAEAVVVEARTARDREANLHREQMFQMWSLALLGGRRYSAGGNVLSVLVGAVSGAVCAVLIVRWLKRAEVF